MTLLSCGCEQDGSARCGYHKDWCCHSACLSNPDHAPYVVCPPCRLAKWRSVSLSSAATPTRGKAE